MTTSCVSKTRSIYIYIYRKCEREREKKIRALRVDKFFYKLCVYKREKHRNFASTIFIFFRIALFIKICRDAIRTKLDVVLRSPCTFLSEDFFFFFFRYSPNGRRDLGSGNTNFRGSSGGKTFSLEGPLHR